MKEEAKTEAKRLFDKFYTELEKVHTEKRFVSLFAIKCAKVACDEIILMNNCLIHQGYEDLLILSEDYNEVKNELDKL